ncbi:50S ribosomal protein L19 [bacterium]|nr:50S ribosomal protein L19 [bacterium]
MDRQIKDKIQLSLLKKRPEVKVGDTVKLSMKIKEGDKSRTQMFEGVVIQKRGSGIDSTITVRKISYGVGVEKIVPMHSPALGKIEVVKRGKVRKSKLYFMKSRIGKRALKIEGIEDVYLTDEAEEVVPAAQTDSTEHATEAETEAKTEESK